MHVYAIFCCIMLYYHLLDIIIFQLRASIIFTDFNISLNPQSLIFVNLKFEAPTSLRVKWSVVPLWSHQPDANGCSATRTACESQRKASSKIFCMFGAENVLNVMMMMMMMMMMIATLSSKPGDESWKHLGGPNSETKFWRDRCKSPRSLSLDLKL